MPASSAAIEKVLHDSLTSKAGVTPGSINELPAFTTADAPVAGMIPRR
jgi:hypothetical protein